MSENHGNEDIDLIAQPTSVWVKWCESRQSVGELSSAVAVRIPGEIHREDVGQATTLCALCPFVVRTEMFGIRSLSLAADATIDDKTARSFPRLTALRVESRRPISVEWFEAAPLEVLAFRDRAVSDQNYLQRLRLRECRVEWTEMHLSNVPLTVRRLIINAWRSMGPSILKELTALTGLEELALSGLVELKDLKYIGELQALTTLTVPARSLNGIEGLKRLRSLRLIAHAPALAPLASSNELQSLEIRARRAPSDLMRLSSLRQLKRLVLDLGDVTNLAGVASLSFLKEMTQLTELIIRGVRVLDGDVNVLKSLNLERLDLRGDFGPQAASLQSAVPAATMRLVANADLDGRAEVVREEGGWAIFSDVASELGYENNYDLESVLKKALLAVAPEVLSRLVFDSEAGALCVRATAKRDINKVMTTLRTIPRRPGTAEK
jgi:hypothetical protein